MLQGTPPMHCHVTPQPVSLEVSTAMEIFLPRIEEEDTLGKNNQAMSFLVWNTTLSDLESSSLIQVKSHDYVGL